MPRAKVVATYLDTETGRYVTPPQEVELSAKRFSRLERARCVERVGQGSGESGKGGKGGKGGGLRNQANKPTPEGAAGDDLT